MTTTAKDRILSLRAQIGLSERVTVMVLERALSFGSGVVELAHRLHSGPLDANAERVLVVVPVRDLTGSVSKLVCRH